ncbi:MAG: phosphatase PAP2 family protein [Rickettsiales bacterium]|nr:phosphatase PAP2 family protein [Rickettsiales bacterium]
MRIANSKTFVIFLASILIFVSVNSYASDIKPYFKGTSVSPELLKNPSLPASKKYKDEVRYIIKLQQNPDLGEIEEAFKERHLEPEMVATFVNKNLTRDKCQKLYQLLDRVHQTSRVVTSNAKNYWDMKRPYVAIETIKPLIAAHSNPAYPSGHTTGSYTIARVLSMVFPKQKSEFISRAQEIAEHRILVGMHFPQDIEAGKELSLLIVGGLIQDKHFLKDLEKAKKEVLDIDK